MTLIDDDFSHYTTLYLLKSKSEVSSKIIEYINFVQNKFNRNVKILRTDNGTEYTVNTLNDFLKKHGIKHEYSAPYLTRNIYTTV